MRRKRRIISIGDLNQLIKIQERSLNTQFQTGVKDQITFTTIAEPWAMVETTKGSIFFGGVGLDREYSHKFYIRYRCNIDQTKFIEYKKKRYDILDVENLDERDEFLLLRCFPTGTNNSPNKAAEG